MTWISDCLRPARTAGGRWLGRPMRVFGEGVSAGFPSPAEGYEDEPLDLQDYLVRRPAATFFYRVRGDDLSGEHVRDGSILVVDRSLRPRVGVLVVVEAGGRFAVERLRDDGEAATVCGVVVAVVLRFSDVRTG